MRSRGARLVAIVWLALAAAVLTSRPAEACTTGGCVTAGPRLADVSSTQGALLNTLLGTLTGSSVSLSVLDWKNIAQGNVDLAKMLSALQTTLNVSSPSSALAANASVVQIVNAAAASANADGNTALGASLNALGTQLGTSGGSVQLGQLLQVNGAVGNAQVNALDIVMGTLQLYNRQNVATTPTPITVSGTNVLGLTGVNQVQLYAQVVEPPVYVCGPVGSQFHTAAIRIKLNITLQGLSPSNLGSLLGLLNVTAGALTLTNLTLYVEVARADGTITAINALTNALNLQATPGVADVYLGSISDAVFWNRSRVLVPATDLSAAQVGNMTVTVSVLGLGLVVSSSGISLKSYARGQAPSVGNLNFTPAYPKTQTVSTGASFVSNLAGSLVTNMQITLPALDAVTQLLVIDTVKTLTGGLLQPLLGTLLGSLVNPLLELVGVRLGQVDVTVGGVFQLCSVTGLTYSDVNHTGRREYPESGTGLALYAKLLNAGGTVLQTATVDTTTGSFSLSNVTAGSAYSVLIDDNATPADVTPAIPTGWIATEVPTMLRAFTLSTDRSDQTFGLFNGSRIVGTVFRDDGTGGSTANDGVKQANEVGLAAVALRVTNAAGTVTYDSQVTADAGAYTLWIPASAGATSLRVVETNVATTPISTAGNAGTTGGTYDRTTDTVTFTNVIGTSYANVNFGDVAANAFITDGQQVVLPGQVAFYTHAFIAGTAGNVTFSGAVTAQNGWSYVFYSDANCNGIVDGADALLTTATAVTAQQKLCVTVKVTSAENAPFDTRYALTVSASFAFANSALLDAQSRSDLTRVGNSLDAGLRLTKSVDRATAVPGQTLVYTISFQNAGDKALTQLKVRDATPTYTVLASAACGALPGGLTSCTLTTQPAVGATGSIEWSFGGNLVPGAASAVTYSVVIQ